jgi:propanol-preferring alcohol dehydrogenase
MERSIRSVANLTRADGEAFFRTIAGMELTTETTAFTLTEANTALAWLRSGAMSGAAVLIPGG